MNDDDFARFEKAFEQYEREQGIGSDDDSGVRPHPDPVSTAWRVAGQWITERDRELRRHTRLADAETVTRRALVPLILYSMKVGDGRPSQGLVYALTFALEQDINDENVVNSDGEVNPDSLLYTVFMHQQTMRPRPKRRYQDPTIPAQSPEDLLHEVLAFEPGVRTLTWQAIRGVTQPATAPRLDSSGLQYQSSLDEPIMSTRPGAGLTLAEVDAQLQSLIGLDRVKDLVSANAAVLANDRDRQRLGLRVPDRTRHLVLTGNPGTGKTTVARLITALYHQHGIVPDGQLVETDRSGLVGEYLGHSAQKTKKVIDAARGGVLFVDEAYALAGDSHDGADRFALEALATLVKAMEDHRDDLVVILAGYPDPMRRLMDVNPGLASRIGTTIEFPDYSTSDLIQILTNLFADYDYDPPAEMPAMVEDWLAGIPRDHTFGNARLMRTLFEGTINAHGVRTQSNSPCSLIEQCTVTSADTLTALAEQTAPQPDSRPIGFVGIAS